MKNHNFIESLDAAVEGFIYCLRSQRNMRIHFILAVFVLIIGIYANFTRLEMAILAGVIALVLFAEVINTAVELTLDLLKTDRDNLIRRVKDISAAAVLVTSLAAIVVGYLLFFNRLHFPWESAILRIRQSDWHTTLIILIVVISCVLLGKLVFHRGSPLRGGMPSGHSAFAFSVWTMTFLLQKSDIVTVLVLILAILIARSRYKEKVHSTYEITAGALLGILITILIYQFLK